MNLASTSLWNFGWIQTHPKWLREKPLCKRAYAQWFLIQKAEEEKLLKVTITLPEDAKKGLMSDVRDNFPSDYVSKAA